MPTFQWRHGTSHPPTRRHQVGPPGGEATACRPAKCWRRARAAVPALGMATVYRNLKLLVAEGAVQVITLPGESPRYEMRESAHHHHFQCTTCRRVYDVPGCPGNLRRLAPRGFRVDHHDVTLYGRCSDCGTREARAAR